VLSYYMSLRSEFRVVLSYYMSLRSEFRVVLSYYMSLRSEFRVIYVYLPIVVSNTYCVVSLIWFSSSCILCSHFLWIVLFGLPLWYSLAFIYIFPPRSVHELLSSYLIDRDFILMF
jgi:hypothetical protein